MDITPPSQQMLATTRNPDELVELHRLCSEGRLYETEAWIRSGRPVQLEAGVATKTRKPISALFLAVEKGCHSLVQLLLREGYNPALERESPFNVAFKVRRADLVELLLEGGADAHGIDRTLLFETYDGELFERFYQLGVDLTVHHDMGAAIGTTSGNRPLYGFVKRHAPHDKSIAFQLQIALNTSIDEGNERGTALCLWAGADPRAVAPSMSSVHSYEAYKDAEPPDRWLGRTALEEAVWRDNAALLKRFRPTKNDNIDELLDLAGTPEIIEHLFAVALPQSPVQWLAQWRRWPGFGETHGRGTAELFRKAFHCGLRVVGGSANEISHLRSNILKVQNGAFSEIIRALAEEDYCSSEVLAKLGSSEALRRKMREHGFLERADSHYNYRTRDQRLIAQRFDAEPKPRPTAASKQTAKPKFHVPNIVEIGRRFGIATKTIDRQSLFELVWSEPVEKIAEKWGLSGRGVAKGCARARVPVPPRGYWARVQNGATIKRPKLPTLDVDYEPKIVVPAADHSAPSS